MLGQLVLQLFLSSINRHRHWFSLRLGIFFQNSMIGVNNHLGRPEGWRFMKQLSSLLPFSYGGIYFWQFDQSDPT